MAFVCPRCNNVVHRNEAGTGTKAAFGVVGALISSAFGSFECPSCGKIAKSEFPPEVRSKMMMGTLGLTVAGIAVAVTAIWLIVWINSW